MIDKNIFSAVAACAVALSSPFADGEELYAFEFLHLGKAVGRNNDDPGPRLDPGSRPGLDPARCFPILSTLSISFTTSLAPTVTPYS